MLLVSVSHFVDSRDETLTVIKPVSIKLQKKSNDIVKAYNMIAETGKELRQMRNNADTVFKAWYANAIDLEYYHRTLLFLSLTISRRRCHQGKHFKYTIYCISLYLPCQFKVTHIHDKAPLDSS